MLCKLCYPAPAGNKTIVGNIKAICDFKCLDFHNSLCDGLIEAVEKCATADQGMPFGNECVEIHPHGVDGLFFI